MDKAKARINHDKCIGCAECLAVCRFNAVKYDWGAQNDILQKNIAEHALGAIKGKQSRAAFFNFLISITPNCDCMGRPNLTKMVEDIGILASTDPVAVDQAAIHLVENAGGKPLAGLLGQDELDPQYQIEYAPHV